MPRIIGRKSLTIDGGLQTSCFGLIRGLAYAEAWALTHFLD